MRYTTIIDISEFPTIYRNVNARLLYLHLCLKAGYHDNDRDVCEISIRRMAAEISLTLSATRHALKVLEKAKLIERYGPAWRVRKFIVTAEITPRIKSEKKRKEIEIREQERQMKEEQERREKEEKERYLAARKKGHNPFESMIKELEDKAAMGDLDAAERLKFWRQTKKN